MFKPRAREGVNVEEIKKHTSLGTRMYNYIDGGSFQGKVLACFPSSQGEHRKKGPNALTSWRSAKPPTSTSSGFLTVRQCCGAARQEPTWN